MVRAIRFWVQATGVAVSSSAGGMNPTAFGRDILSEENGYDPYLEDTRTLWLVHWKLAANFAEPLFAWEYLLSRWPHPEFTAASALDAFTKESAKLERTLSAATLTQHFEVFLHTYVPTRSAKGEVREDNLDSPLVELDLIRRTGERRGDSSDRIEVLYAFNCEPKLTITPEVFVYCLNDYWDGRHPNEETISFRELALGVGSPGQIFKLTESDLRDRLQTLGDDSRGAFNYRESSALAQIIRTGQPKDLLANVYCHEEIHA